MKRYLTIAAISLISVGCGSYRSNTSTTAPAGPIQTGIADPNLIPAGTEFAVRVNDAINTEQAGGVYSAEVAQTIMNSRGEVLIPRGAPAELMVVETDSGGVTGTRSVSLAVRSVTVNGRRYNLTTDSETARGREGLGANRRTAEMVGGGAALGTLLGAVIGGGAGAAAGAAIGAAGGATAQVLTRGDEVRVPAETVLTFRLDQPIRLT